MENNHHNDNFERFLRDKTDDFVLYPSKRIWYSIYNNMHPGNRLPSISMCIILMFALLLVGYLHTGESHISKTANKALLAKQQVANVVPINSANPFVSGIRHLRPSEEIGAGNTFTQNISKKILPELSLNISSAKSGTAGLLAANKNSNQLSSLQQRRATNRRSDRKNLAVLQSSQHNISVQEHLSITKNAAVSKNNDISISAEKLGHEVMDRVTVKLENTEVVISEKLYETASTDLSSESNADQSKIAAAVDEKTVVSAKTGLSESDKLWMENYALYNRPAPKKWAGKLSLQGYLTPSIVYRSLRNNALDKPGIANASGVNSGNVNDFVNNKPSFGIETGMAIQYNIVKRIKLKAGVQFNYTRYNAHGFDNFHPISTSLTMNDGYSYESFATTPYSNSFGIAPVKLHNETLQFSLPVGVDFRITSIDNIEWYAGATIQPTVILHGQSYVISSDRRNYVNNPSLLNRFNVNAGFETYISYKTNGYIWQVGPQFRSQLFSTNTRLFSVEERLVNYGFKVGVSKKL